MSAEHPRSGDPLPVEALRSLSTDYAAAVDARDGDALAALFVESGELLVPDVPADLRPVVRRAGSGALRRVPEGLRRYARTFHQVSDHRFTIAGDRATGEVRCVAHHVTADPAAPTGAPTEDRPEGGPQGWPESRPGARAGTDTVWYIRYDDDYVRTDRGWRIERRVLHLQWVEEHPVSVLPVPPPSGQGVGTS